MIGVAFAGAIARVTLDRWDARNAISLGGWQAIAAAARDAAAAGSAAVIVESAVPGIFSAGADLGEMAVLAHDHAARASFRETMRAGIEAVAAIPVPVIAAVDGGCYGAAVALALAADLRIAGDGAVFATTPARLGIGYPGSDVARLIERIGRGQAARMLLTAETIDADEAHRIGLVELRACDARAAGEALAERIASLAPEAVQLLKRTLADPGGAWVEEAFDAAFGGAAFAERLAAFRSRRR